MPSFAQTFLSQLSVNMPTFVALDEGRTIGGVTADWLYVSEHGDIAGTPPTGGGRIFRFNLTSGGAGVAIAQRYDATTNPNGFIAPDGIVVDPTTGDLIIADRYLNRVQRITNTGTFVMRWGSTTSGASDEMHGPIGLARDSAGAIYVTEHGEMNTGPGGMNVSKYTLAGTAAPTRNWRVGGTAKGSGDGQFNTPYAVSISGSSVLVSDGFNYRVQRLSTADGSYQSQFSVGATVIPLGSAVTGSTLWLVETNGDTGSPQRVNRRDVSTGAQLAAGPWGTEGSGNGQFQLPFSVAVNAAGTRAYVSDYHNNRVQIFDLAAATPAAPVVNSPSTATATVGAAFSYQITATNSPTSYNATGLPAGLTVNTATGVISGTPTAAGSSNVILTATNGSGTSANFTLALTVSAATTTSGPSVTSFAWSGTDLTFRIVFSEAVTGVDASDFDIIYSGNANAAGAAGAVTGSGTSYTIPFTWNGGGPGAIYIRIHSTGTGITGASGAFAGAGVTETHVPVAGTGDATPPTVVSFTPGTPSGNTVNFTLTFSESIYGLDQADISLVTGSAAGTTIGRFQYADTTGTSYTIPVTYTASSGTIQLALSATGGATGSVRDGNNNALAANATSTAFTITGGGGGGTAPAITSPTTASATVGTAFSYQIAASGSPTSFNATGLTGTGLAVNTTTGAITGTPTAAGTITSTISATNATGTGSATLTITVGAAGAAPVISSPTTASATVGTAFSYQIAASGSPTSFNATGLASTGLAVNTTTGAITGTPTAAGTITSTISATNATGTGSATLTITVGAAGAAPVISSAGTASATAGTAFTYQITATGSPTSYAATGLTGTGLSVNTSTGLISGTPTAAGTITSTVSATNTTGTGSRTLTITVGAAATAPVISSAGSASATVGTAFSYQITASGSPTSYAATGLTGTGLSVNTTTGLISGTPTAAGTVNATVSATNAVGTGSKAVTITVAATGPAPTVTSTTVAAITGSPFSYQIQATNNPTGYAAGSLPSGLTINTTTGLISGTPTVAGNSTVSISATNASGTGTGSLAFAITAGGSSGGGTPPPVFTGGGGGGFATTIVFVPVNGAVVDQPITLSATASSGQTVTFMVVSGNATLNGNVLTPKAAGAIVVRATANGSTATADQTITAKANQTVTFASPVSAIQINTPITLSATSSAGQPITFSVLSGSATINGNTLTPTGPGAIVVRATAAGNATVAAATADVNVGSPQKAGQTINIAGVADTTVTAGPISVSASASSGLPVTLSVSGPARLSGSTIVLNGVPGTITVRASQAGNDIFGSADVTRTFAVRAVGQQVYLGTMGSDAFAIVISQDNARGVFVTRLAGSGEAIVGKFTLAADGTFRVNATSSLPASGNDVNPNSDAPAFAALTAPRTLSGTVSNGVVTGSIAELGTNFSATVSPATGTTASLAGVYIASMPGSASGDTYIVAGPNGTAYAVAVTPFGVSSGTGTIAADGAINITTSGSGSLTGKIDANTGMLNGTLTLGSKTAALVGLSEGATRSDRIVNLSSRLRVVSGDASRSVIAGFVVSGTESKQVLIRAVGPGLTGFGVSDALANPKLQLFNSAGAMISENDDWSNNADVAATGDAVGAFKLGASSRDSAIVATLAPGAYTAIVTGVGGNGVALIEVYDAASNQPLGSSQRLVNISTRGYVDTGDGNLIAGFVVTGNAPKRVLIRGIGPSLTQFGVAGAVADPSLKLYAAGSATVIAQNDDWSTPQTVNAAQTAATAAEISAASTITGAFPLAANSKDAAIVITLMPGAYSAVVSGASNSTGAGLVEVYEISNQ